MICLSLLGQQLLEFPVWSQVPGQGLENSRRGLVVPSVGFILIIHGASGVLSRGLHCAAPL